MIYKYAQLDNRPTPEARAHNEAIFASGPVWGLEVTNKEWAGRCEVNVDPQHGNSKCTPMNAGVVAELFDSTRAACEVAQFIDQPAAHIASSVTLLFDRVDLDAVCAAAVLELREGPEDVAHKIADRIRQVAEADNFKVGKTPWQPYPLPTKENPWLQGASIDSRRELAAINRAVMDRSVPLETKVEWVKTWLLTGKEPTPPGPYSNRSGCEWCGEAHCECGETDGISDPREHYSYRNEIERERQEIVEALSMGALTDTIDTCISSGVSIVSMPGKAYPGATGLGFALAPVTVCVADHFQPGDYRKVTIASWGVLRPEQMEAIQNRLNELEPIWGIKSPWGKTEPDQCLTYEEASGHNAEAGEDGYDLGVDQQAPGWGGNLQSGILGSPQGRSTAVTVHQILDAIREVQ